jgi:hypothetical protein
VRGIIRTEPRSEREDEEGAEGAEEEKKKKQSSKQKKDRGPVVSDLNLRYRALAATVPQMASFSL